MTVGLDATYSVGEGLSGVGLYSREMLWGLAGKHPEAEFEWWYRAKPYWRARAAAMPPNARRRLLAEPWGPRKLELFHGLNQRLPKVRMKRAVVTFHDLFVMTGEYSTAEFRARFAQQARDAAERADAIVTVSEFTKRQVVELLRFPAERVFVVHHGTRKLNYGGQGRRENVVLNVGAIQTRKNVGRLVEAFETMDGSWRLVLAGAMGYGAEEIERRIEASAARERISVLGYVTPGELAEWYGRAAIFAFPSLDEGFGMPVLEAMASGTPVITSNRSALPEVAGDAAVLVDPEDTGKLAWSLRELAGDEELREELGEKGRKRAGFFTWEKAVRETWEVYRKVS